MDGLSMVYTFADAKAQDRRKTQFFDFGSDLGSPVSADYYDQAPVKFNGTIGTTKIAYPKK